MGLIGRERTLEAAMEQIVNANECWRQGQISRDEMLRVVEDAVARASTYRGAVEALRALWDDMRYVDKEFVPDDVRAQVEAVLSTTAQGGR